MGVKQENNTYVVDCKVWVFRWKENVWVGILVSTSFSNPYTWIPLLLRMRGMTGHLSLRFPRTLLCDEQRVQTLGLEVSFWLGMLFNKNKCMCRTCISYGSHGQDTIALQTNITWSILSLPICVNHLAKTILKSLHPSKVWWTNLNLRNCIESSHKCSFCSKQWGCWLRFISQSSYIRG